MKKYKKITIVAIIVLLIVIPIIPVALNFILQIPIKWVPIIGGNNSETVWLNFYGSYLGAIFSFIGVVISSLITFYILYINRKDNFNVIQYQKECEDFQKELADLITYTTVYYRNHIFAIYYKWKSAQQPGSIEVCEQVKFLMDKSATAYGMLTVYEPVGSKKDFFIKQEKNYKLLVCLLKDLNALVISDSSKCDIPKHFNEHLNALSSENKDKKIKPEIISEKFWKDLNKPENQAKRVFDIFLETYKDIDFENIDAQVKEFINSEREALNLKFKDMQ